MKSLFFWVALTAASLLVYDLLVRRKNGTRFLFGTKPRKKVKSAREAVPMCASRMCSKNSLPETIGQTGSKEKVTLMVSSSLV